ncbi:MAG TPA: 50S ribosomal protein L17 [Phycisphaerae bacterium]|nr:50S ribosomal protein L17 [Phycisphaerae bacterium]
MRHGSSKRHLARTPAHLLAMRRNMAQSLFQYGQIETTLIKAKAIRSFVEKLITIARRGDLAARRRIESLLTDRAVLDREQEAQYETMSMADRSRVMGSRAGRRHRLGKVPASYNKKKVSFVAGSIVHKLMTEVAPLYKNRPGGYTRIIRLSKRRVGDAGDLAILQLIDADKSGRIEVTTGAKKSVGIRRRKVQDRIRVLEGKKPVRQRRKASKSSGTQAQTASPAAAAEPPEAT